jgi:hypothetical protein
MGWFKDPARHALAARGIGTGRLAYSQLESVRTGHAPRGHFGLGYVHLLNKLSKKYEVDQPTGITEGDYESVVQPLFDELSAADFYCDHGLYKEAAEHLECGEDRFGSLSKIFNVITDDDAREFLGSAQAITRKVVAGSRAGSLPRASPAAQTADKPRVDERNSDSR